MKHAQILFPFIAFTGFLLIWIIPPFQKTDEISHFYKTIAVAHGNLFCHLNSQARQVNTFPNGFMALPQQTKAEYVNENQLHRFPIKSIADTLNTPYSKQLLSEETLSCSLPFLFYLPTALILAPFIYLSTAPIIVFYLGRVVFYLMSLGLFYLSIKMIPSKYRLLQLFTLSLPMVLIEMGSYNKEVWVFGFGALSFSFFLRLRLNFSFHEFLAFILCLGLSILPRPLYFPLFALILLVLPPHFFQQFHSKRVLTSAGALLLSILLISQFFIPKLLQFHSPIVTELGISSPLQLRFVQEHLLYLMTVLWNSYTNHIQAYYRSFVGTFGSIHYYLDWYVYAFYAAFLFFVLHRYTIQRSDFRKKELALIAVLLAIITFLTFFMLYLYATPVGYHYVIDVQGRYFIMLFPYTAIVMSALMRTYKQHLFAGGLILVMLFLTKNAFDRYFDYSIGFIDASFPIESSPIQVVNQSYIHIPILPDKKIIGLAVKVFNNQEISLPLLITIFDEKCETQKDEILVMTHTLKETRILNTLLHHPIKQQSQLCIQLTPLGKDSITNARIPTLAGNPKTNRPDVLPLYAY